MRQLTYLPPPPRWVTNVARPSAFTPVPASLWRLPLIFGISMGMPDALMDDLMNPPLWMRAAYLVGLGELSDGCAYLTLAWCAPWA
jgi:hypothetical protein